MLEGNIGCQILGGGGGGGSSPPSSYAPETKGTMVFRVRVVLRALGF